MKSISDLQGKTVSFGDLDSATSTSGRMLFSRLGVTANQTNEPLPEALDRLSAGKVDAVVVLGAEEFACAQRLRQRRSLSHRAHSVVAGFGARLCSGSRDRRPTGPISSARPIPSKRSANRWRWSRSMRPQDRRARMDLAGLRALFFDNYDGFLADEHDLHWRDVNLAADASWPTGPWPRLRAAQSWLDAKKPSARRIARCVPSLGQVGRRIGQLAKRGGFGSTL